MLGHRGWAQLRRGALGDAEADLRTVLDLLTSHEIRLGDAFARALLCEVLIERGDLAAADGMLGATGELGPGHANAYTLQARALLRLAQGAPEAALADLRAFGAGGDLPNPAASGWRAHAARALLESGDAAAARALAAEELTRARGWGTASGIGVALRTAALVEDDGEAAIALLREAVDVLAGSPARLEHARALIDLGAALRRANRRADARPPLEQGVALAERCGAAALAERGRVELRASGGRSSDPHGSGAEQLTVSERRVAELAAEGRSNPEIAQQLFVTRKTVETHLGRVYRKLGIGGRSELQHALTAS